MDTVFEIPWDSINAELPVFSILSVWNLLVVMVISKWIYQYAIQKGRSHNSSVYFSRKAIHFLAGGLTAALLPFFALEPVLPALLAIGFALITYIPHRTGRLLYWFQDPENIYEVDFTVVWGLIIFFTWFIDRTFWLGVIPVLFMAFGDGITGIIRNFKYNKRTKAWEGTAGMLVICLVIGAGMGVAGMVAAVACSFVERIELIDDNISVPMVSLGILLAAHFYFPSLITSFY